jgi:hypothetical protein
MSQPPAQAGGSRSVKTHHPSATADSYFFGDRPLLIANGPIGAVPPSIRGGVALRKSAAYNLARKELCDSPFREEYTP